MFRVKICGITNVPDALAAANSGADAVGLNFYSASSRFCPPQRAAEIAKSLPASICKVGVFVNATPQEVLQRHSDLNLDLVQLHGDESPEVLRALRGVPVMRAFRIADDLNFVSEYLSRCYQLRCLPRMVLLDASREGQFGGTGATLDWKRLIAQRQHLGGAPMVLAGGLNPSNVAEAITTTRPWAVDTASGVENGPGQKSADLISQFVAAATKAFAQLT